MLGEIGGVGLVEAMGSRLRDHDEGGEMLCAATWAASRAVRFLAMRIYYYKRQVASKILQISEF